MLEKNMKVLRKYDSELHEKIKNIKVDNSLEIIEARNGSPSLKMKNEEGDLFIHSKYNPEREAERYVANLDLDGVDAICLLGLGLGYHILELYERIKEKDIKFFIIESSYSIFFTALKYQDFRPLLKDVNCHFIIEDNESEIDIFDYIASSFDDTFFKDLITFKWEPLLKIYNNYYQEVGQQLIELQKHLYANQNTLTHFAQEWNEHILKNMEEILFDPGFNFIADLYKDIPIIVVAAGPSLDKNIDLLPQIKNKAVIIAVSNALKALLKKDIVPDFVVAADSSEILKKHFPNYKDDLLEEIVLAYDPVVYPEIINDWPGSKVVASPYKADVLLDWIEQFSEYKGRVFFGGSVAHAAFSLAYFFGGDPIVFVGQDLALSNGYTHVKGSCARQTIEENKIKTNKRKINNRYYRIEDIYGNEVVTKEDYYSYLKWFNRTLEKIKKAQGELKIIDATEGGARIENTEIMSLQDVIDKYCNTEYNIKTKLFSRLNEYENKVDKNIINELEKIISDLTYVSSLAERGLNIVDKLIDNLHSSLYIQDSKEDIKYINQEINELIESLVFFEFEFYDIFSKRINNKFNKHLNRDSNLDNDLYLNQITDYYNRIKNGSNKVKDIFKNIVIDLKHVL